MLLPALEPSVVQAAFAAVTELLTCCGLGVAATQIGLIDATTTRALAKAVFNIFLPSMLVTSVSRTVASGAGLRSLLPLPFCALVQVCLGLALVSPLLGGPRRMKQPGRRDVAALASFGNSGVLPLVFADCLFRSQPALLARANSLVAMFLLGWSPLFWTAGFALLAGRHTPRADAGSADSAEAAEGASQQGYWEGLRQRVLTPPILGCLSGIVIGSIPPLRALLVPPPGGSALLPLPLHRCLEAFGKACTLQTEAHARMQQQQQQRLVSARFGSPRSERPKRPPRPGSPIARRVPCVIIALPHRTIRCTVPLSPRWCPPPASGMPLAPCRLSGGAAGPRELPRPPEPAH